MLKTVISSRALIPLSLVLAAGTGLLTAAPAYAGERDRAASSTAKTFKAQPKRTSQTRSTRGVRVAAGDVNGRRSTGRRTARSQDGGGGIFNNGGTIGRSNSKRRRGGARVSSGDINAQAPRKGGILTGLLLPAVQKASAQTGSGRTRARADVNSNHAEGGGPHVKVFDGHSSSARAKLSQNGTTVATANEIKGPETGATSIGGDGADVLRGGAGNDTLISGRSNDSAELRRGGAGNDTLISGRDKDPATGKPFRQEPGTTVPTADDVQAPQVEQQVGLLLPAVQKVREAAPRSGGK